MRKIPVHSIKPGTKLARGIYCSDGRLLLAEGTALSKSYIRKLTDMGIYHIYVEDEISRGIDIQDVISGRTRIQARTLIKKVMEDISSGDRIDVSAVNNVVESIMDELIDNRNIMLNIEDIKTIDDYTFSHSVNVCTLSMVTGLELGYNKVQLKKLGVGALLHDIGKMRVSRDIINKPDLLSEEEYEEIKKHTIYGHEILKENPDITYTSRFVALAHHERYDGSGYPLALKGKDTHEFVKIVSVVDVYDALTSDRVYKNRMERHEAIEYIMSMTGRYFDHRVVEAFVKNIPAYPPGSIVLLSTGEKAIVTASNKNFPTRPVVRVVKDSRGNSYDRYREIDLKDVNNITIKVVCDEI